MFGSNRRGTYSEEFRAFPAREREPFGWTASKIRDIYERFSGKRRAEVSVIAKQKGKTIRLRSCRPFAIAMTPLSRKGNKRRATNRRGWRHVAVLCSSRLVSLERRGHEKKKEESDGEEKGEKWRLLISQDRNPVYAI